MTTKKSHEDIIKRIRAFLNMTVERGAGEAEAIMAARKAAELMAEYDLSLSDLDAGERPSAASAILQRYRFDIDFTRFVYQLIPVIEKLCNVSIYQEGINAGSVGTVGMPVDVEIAHYLLEVCVVAMRYELLKAEKDWVLLVRRQRKLKEGFLQGLVQRLIERLEQLAWARRGSGTALVVLTQSDIDDVLKRERKVETLTRNRGRTGDLEGLLKGRQAAESVALNNAIGSDLSGNRSLAEFRDD